MAGLQYSIWGQLTGSQFTMKQLIAALAVLLGLPAAGQQVGIGTAQPQQWLHLHSPADRLGVQLSNAASTADSARGFGIYFQYRLAFPLDHAVTLALHEAGSIRFQTGGFEALRIDNLGQVGIGTALPASRLHIAGDATLTGRLLRPTTGPVDLLPRCYGSVSPSGAVLAGTGNFTATRLSAGVYEIAVQNVSVNLSSHIVLVSTIGTAYRTAMASAAGGLLVLRSFDGSGTPTDNAVHFVLYLR